MDLTASTPSGSPSLSSVFPSPVCVPAAVVHVRRRRHPRASSRMLVVVRVRRRPYLTSSMLVVLGIWGRSASIQGLIRHRPGVRRSSECKKSLPAWQNPVGVLPGPIPSTARGQSHPRRVNSSPSQPTLSSSSSSSTTRMPHNEGLHVLQRRREPAYACWEDRTSSAPFARRGDSGGVHLCRNSMATGPERVREERGGWMAAR